MQLYIVDLKRIKYERAEDHFSPFDINKSSKLKLRSLNAYKNRTVVICK